MRARPVARAQVARQEGEHLAALLSRYKLVPAKEPAADSNARADRDGDGHEDGAAARDGDIIPMPKGAPSFRWVRRGQPADLTSSRVSCTAPRGPALATPHLREAGWRD
jgi:hypothetical protein